ncbi:Aspartyl-tRNA(Asn)/glutamyl-tRNA(Gln) amidotransferase subunit A [Bosea sp. 62]|uniref:amidase n=1 Tax=unclassified Bosea (in: a-proteobacteria) TaxID=2653178 RepID=UPI00125B75A2|nr:MULTISPECIES: amidase [unclassified Bosea (in: a-proteobacteria)]CAD5253866.1 Aspartyl-tRNA(Asn)/glutamyl-tRNA(Gln) amidotransferase subunit A [Bosea sp. 21B]CAD5286958.1 Aspartyl-tRNA(Asn)/glutamyl-tRNA(Gln) amidotransferase subunit A [Bosea sp. 7B]CAD5301227.1 Aspartyl-tRNA(Asn)/glutamyl-tRNA(Gln) amidotransferase subunit A [Bosea sp. 46]VVT57346.1 Aspartyl-tRNA(Asn)/glutamyl-tRNA(Gln) amidotransferase subunit A [Bosea sp. EC-HK365B]VXB66268.1 Aspartyl-tRNA(Asn)/glutamyl-tRNA(Gln) amidotr
MSRSVRDKLEANLARIGDGTPVFTKLLTDTARVEADAADRRREAGLQLSAIDGTIVSVKDLLDVKGITTWAGSSALKGAAPAAQDAPSVARLRRAGAVIIGKTNMTEFAFSGIGLNNTFGTPGSAVDKARIPGGSSSGAAVSVAEGSSELTVGTDTGGSCRIPAAFNGITGMKPTHKTVPDEGCFPLAPSLDSIGPLAKDVAGCARLLSVLADRPFDLADGLSPARIRLGVARGGFLAEADPSVAKAYEAAIERVTRLGIAVEPVDLDGFYKEMLAIAPVPLVTIEAAAVHRDLMASKADSYDRRVAARIAIGVPCKAADYIIAMEKRRSLIARFAAQLDGLDGFLAPTVPIEAPTIAAMEAGDEAFFNANRLILRNPAFGNLFDLCSISLPMPLGDKLSGGLMLSAVAGRDQQLLNIAKLIEPAAAG